MGTSSKALAIKLRKLADRQHGCFTAAQAVEMGYADSVHLYHVKSGEWIRVSRGIYRFTNAPDTPACRCMAALLWTRDKNGVVQGFLLPPTIHALRNNRLAIGDPIHIGVPKGFRRSSQVPETITLESVDSQLCKTSKMNGLRIQIPPDDPPPDPAEPAAELDRSDYYDWLDYQAVRCSSTSS